MAQIALTPLEFADQGHQCPACCGDIEITFKVDHLIHIDCPYCTWEDMFTAVYHVDPFDCLAPF